MLDDTTDRASFSAMVDGTADDYAKISAAFGEFSKTLPDRVMAHLQMLQGDFDFWPKSTYASCKIEFTTRYCLLKRKTVL